VSQFQAVWDSEWSLLCPSGKVQPEGHANLAIIILEGQNNYNDKFNGPPMKRLDPGDASEEKTFVFVGERRFEGWPNALLMQVPQAKEPIHQRYAIKVSSPSSIETVRPRSVIMANFPGHKDDTFAKAFPDLSSAAVGWEGIPFAKVKEHLDNLSNEKQVFEAFGIKFPIDSAARWAIVMIFATQAFFWIHLDEYFRRRFAVADVAWIGVYPSRSAKAMSAVTFLLAPAGVCVYLAVKQVAVKQVLVSLKLSQLRPIHWLSDGIFFVVPLMSIGLSVVTGVTYWRGTGSQPIRRKAAVV